MAKATASKQCASLMGNDVASLIRRGSSRVAIVTMLLLVSSSVSIYGAPPQITQFSPFALAPGKVNELTLRGQNLADARSIWATFANRCEFLPAEDESSQKGETLRCRITLPREVQVGIGAMRLMTAEGVSKPLLVMLDDLPTTAESSENHAPERAQVISTPVAIDGRCDPVQEDMFRFQAAAGQQLAFEIVAQRLGSKLDPLLRILSADGAEVARVDDAQGASGDVRLAHTFDTAGEYIAAVRDVRHAGGDDYRYRLRVGNFPLITCAYPAGGQGGAVVSFALLGPAMESFIPINTLLPAVSDSPRTVSLGVPSAGSAGSGWFRVEASPGSDTLEVEPNDSPSEATAAALPGSLNGRLDKAGDRDHFKFVAKKGQRLHCLAKTRELGSACDVHMSLHKPDGSQIAVARQEARAVLDAEIPEDGEYLLLVEDLLVDGPAGHVYRIELSDSFARFSLAAEHTQYTSPQAGTFVMKVLAQRHGYDGPVDLAVEGLGEGVKLEGNRLEGAEALLKVTLPAAIPQGELRIATILGTAKIGEVVVTARANQRAALSALFSNVLFVPSELEETVAVGIGPPFPPFFELGVANSEVIFPQLVGQSSFDVMINRLNDAFKDPVSITVEGLPPEITAEVSPVDDGQTAARVSLKGPVDFAEAEVPIRIVGTGRFQEQTRTVVLSVMVLRVTKPVVVSIAMAGPITAGGMQNAKVTVQRFGDDPQPVRVQVSDGPAGLSAPIFVTVSADATEVTIAIAADATATPGTFNNLTIAGTTTFKGQDIAVRSKPAMVEIQPAATP